MKSLFLEVKLKDLKHCWGCPKFSMGYSFGEWICGETPLGYPLNQIRSTRPAWCPLYEMELMDDDEKVL